MGDIIVHVLVWFGLTLVTCGVALFLFPYSLSKLVLDRAYVLDERGQRIGKLECPSDLGGDIVHAIVWWFLTVVTLGIAGFFYAYKVQSTVLSRTRLVPLQP